MIRRPPRSTLFPYTTPSDLIHLAWKPPSPRKRIVLVGKGVTFDSGRSEEHTSELQSLTNIVCRLLLEKKKTHAKTRKMPRQRGTVINVQSDRTLSVTTLYTM